MLAGGFTVSFFVDIKGASNLLTLRRILASFLGTTPTFIEGPIEDVVVLEPLTREEVTKDLTEIGVVRLVIEMKGASIVQVHSKLIREPTAEDLNGYGHLLLHDLVMLPLFRSSLQALPWKGAVTEVYHNVPQGLHVISSRLFCNDVSPKINLVASATYQCPSGC